MSSFKFPATRLSATRAAAVLALAAVSILVGACGYQPLYGQNTESVAATQELAAISVARLPDRPGQQMRTALERRLHGRGKAAAHYVLSVALDESLQTLAEDKAGNTTRANLALTGSYQLRLASSEEPFLTGRARVVTSYNILDSQFATLAAEDDARERGIQLLADEIVERLAIYFRGPHREGRAAPQ